MSDVHTADGNVRVVVRTPAGASHDFNFQGRELVAEAAAKAIEYFVGQNLLEPGDYGLELVRDGQSTDMLDTNTLADYGVRDGDTLHLIPEKPQVDG